MTLPIQKEYSLPTMLYYILNKTGTEILEYFYLKHYFRKQVVNKKNLPLNREVLFCRGSGIRTHDPSDASECA